MRLSLCLIIVPDSWALIKILHLTNNTNDVKLQKQMESFQSKNGGGLSENNKECIVLIVHVGFHRAQRHVESNNL